MMAYWAVVSVFTLLLMVGNALPVFAQEAPAHPPNTVQSSDDQSTDVRSSDDPSADDQVAVTSEDEDEVVDFDQSPHLDNVQTLAIDAKWKRLGNNQIWINHADKQVMVRGRICLREGPLEMFACPGRTKAHESVIATEAKSSEIHASLVALGFPPGRPVQWEPKFSPVEGPSVKIIVRWKEGEVVREVNARDMVKISGTDKTMQHDWVFGGSQIYTDNVSGEKIYYADSGEMVCLSNFSTAMLDIPMESSNSAEGLLFEANAENIPRSNTKVYMVFIPRRADGNASYDRAQTNLPDNDKTNEFRDK